MQKENATKKKAYLCNGNMKGCKRTGCYINGGECRHTTDERYRKNKTENIFDDSGMEIEDELERRDNSSKDDMQKH